jgi:hypothetical protein
MTTILTVAGLPAIEFANAPSQPYLIYTFKFAPHGCAGTTAPQELHAARPELCQDYALVYGAELSLAGISPFISRSINFHSAISTGVIDKRLPSPELAYSRAQGSSRAYFVE